MSRNLSLSLAARVGRQSIKTLADLKFDPTKSVQIPHLFSEVCHDANALWDDLIRLRDANGGYGTTANKQYRLSMMLPTNVMYTNPVQPEIRAEEWSLRKELARTIEESEYISPITCAPDPDHRGHFIFGDGEGRGILSQVNGLPVIPAIIFLVEPELLFLGHNSGARRIPSSQVFQIYATLTETGNFDMRETYEKKLMPKGTRECIKLITSMLSESEWMELAKTGTFSPGIVLSMLNFYRAMEAARSDKKLGGSLGKKGTMPSQGQTLLWMRNFNMWEKVKTLLTWDKDCAASVRSLNQARFAIEANCGIGFDPENGWWVMNSNLTPVVVAALPKRARHHKTPSKFTHSNMNPALFSELEQTL